MNKIAIIGTVGIPANYGGFETLVHNIAPDLAKKHCVTVYCSKKSYAKQNRISYYKGVKLTYLPFSANGLSSIIYDASAILHAVFSHKTLLVLGVSGAFMFPFIKLLTNRKIIVNIDGIEWKRNKWNKVAKWFLRWSEKIAVKFADKVICDNQAVINYVKETYNVDGIYISYGGDHATRKKMSKKLTAKYKFLKKQYCFKVCRIEPENNIEMILGAFEKCPNSNIVIVGNWNRSDFGKKMKLKYKNFENILLLNPIYDLNILDQLRSNCYAYIHGHSAGGTNPSLVEAMNLRLPIISFDVCFNRQTTENRAIYFNNKEKLIQILNSVKAIDLEDNKYNMKEIASRKYTWDIIQNNYAEIFKYNTHNLKKYSRLKIVK